MKIVITGSLGNISKPLTIELCQKGHQVTVISSTPDRKAAIQALGATPAIGTMEDPEFLTETFTGADLVYLMETLKSDAFFDHSLDVIEAVTQIGRNYQLAIQRSGVKKIVHLSSIGADTGPGLLRFHHNVETILGELPQEVAIKFMRPVGFYYVMYGFIPMIKQQGAIFSNDGGDLTKPWVSPLDIAAVIAQEIEQPFLGRSVRYIASDEVSPNQIANVLGQAIGQPDLAWIQISDEQMINSLLSLGMNPQTAQGYVQMSIPIRDQSLYADYYHHQPVLGQVKLTDFARDFAAVYAQNL